MNGNCEREYEFTCVSLVRIEKYEKLFLLEDVDVMHMDQMVDGWT